MYEFKSIIDNSELYLIIYTMLSKFSSVTRLFATAKTHEILKNKFLIETPPKRPLTSYFLFAQDVRAKMPKPKQGQKVIVTEQSKTIAAQWKSITPEEKVKYEEKSKQLRKKYEQQVAAYKAKFEEPFKKVQPTQILQKQFYKNNKFTDLAEGSKAFSEYKKNLKPEDLEKVKKQADQLNSQRQKIAKMYQIPRFAYKDFNAYLRKLRTQDKTIPLKKDLSQKDLAKYQRQFQRQQHQCEEDYKKFAKSFGMTVQDLTKMVNKIKTPGQKIDEKGRNLKMQQKQNKKLAQIQYQKQKKVIAAQKAKLKESAMKIVQRQVKKLDKQLLKKKQGITRVKNRYAPRIARVKRQTVELKETEKATKQLKKTKKAEAQTKTEETQTQAKTATTAKKQAPKPKGRPKKATTAKAAEKPEQNKTEPKKVEQNKTEQKKVEAKN